MTEPVKFVLRIGAATHKKLKKDAHDNNTSMNRIIEDTLTARYKGEATCEEKLDKILSILEEGG